MPAPPLRLGRIYYGWVIVGVLTIANFTQVGEFNPVLAVFMKPFGEDFGWSRAEVSLGITLGSFGGGLIGPLMGPLVDRHGARAMLVGCQIIFGTCLISLSFLNGSLLHFLLAYSLGRVLVQGGTSLATQVAIANWFSLYRGRAMGIAAVGTRAGQAVLPALVAFLSAGPGWRYAWLFLGAIVWVFAIVPSIWLVRRRPEDVGLLPDGAQQRASGRSPVPIPQSSYTLRQALRSPTFWILLFSSCQAFFSGAGLNLHLFPYLTDAGLTIPETVLATSLFFTVSAFGSILWGFVLERFPMRLCLAVALLVSAGGILLLLFTSGLALALLFAVVYGLSFGGNHIVLSAIWPAYYGRANVGAIMGAAMPVQMLANAFGPFFGGWIYDRNGSYGVAFGTYAAALCVGAALALFARRPRFREAS